MSSQSFKSQQNNKMQTTHFETLTMLELQKLFKSNRQDHLFAIKKNTLVVVPLDNTDTLDKD